ncbi:MAG: SIMPL domain-containing protein [Methylocystis sp.]|uniref:SIMPL domain-containing protein n=1 Tax=Methylocystis sp. TaxID=1911079 RepID=UPI003D0F31DD
MIRSLFAFSLGLTLLAAAGHAETAKDSVPNLSVIGEAYEDVAPDVAILRFGVVTERPSAADAAAENARAVKAVLAQLEKLGVPEADVQTQSMTLAPVEVEQRDPKTGKSKTSQKIFRARNDLRARVTQIDKVGEIAGALIDQGVNSFEGIDFEVAHPEQKLDALRREAVKDAERQAKIYAEAAGLRLSRVLEMRPLENVGMRPRAYAATAAGAPPVGEIPLRSGLERLSARVNIVWGLSR